MRNILATTLLVFMACACQAEDSPTETAEASEDAGTDAGPDGGIGDADTDASDAGDAGDADVTDSATDAGDAGVSDGCVWPELGLYKTDSEITSFSCGEGYVLLDGEMRYDGTTSSFMQFHSEADDLCMVDAVYVALIGPFGQRRAVNVEGTLQLTSASEFSFLGDVTNQHDGCSIRVRIRFYR